MRCDYCYCTIVLSGFLIPASLQGFTQPRDSLLDRGGHALYARMQAQSFLMSSQLLKLCGKEADLRQSGSGAWASTTRSSPPSEEKRSGKRKRMELEESPLTAGASGGSGSLLPRDDLEKNFMTAPKRCIAPL
jgi:hypothetical protein